MRSWESERQYRREKGLCFRCGDRFAPGHRCKASLTLLEADNEGETNLEYKDPVIAGEETSSDLAEIGKYQGSTMKLKGLKLVQDCYPSAIGGADMVLGIKWLASLNTVQANWNDMFMIFEWNGKKYKLKGLQHTQSNSVSLQTFQHLANTEPIPTNNLPHQLQPILQDFQAIFTELNTLPPYRTHNHSIPLLANVKPPNIRPYRCPHYQNDEIESQVAALLATGKENKGADALSRRPQYLDFMALAIPFSLDFSDLQDELEKDAYTSKLISNVKQNPEAVTDFNLVQGKLYYKNRLVIPPTSSLRQTLLAEAHESLSGGHGAHGISDSVAATPLPLIELWELLLELDKSLKHRWTKDAISHTLELLVQWKGRPIAIEEASGRNMNS
ncbi:putative mitochondrial protein [Senna tora]|uniref:Putative mitochondrial protein n=1 Tax=Senna tora TaxID=362788 RepID=A0A834WNW9_9FABA|nr:putative mitochondrial protein [Senna tora]